HAPSHRLSHRAAMRDTLFKLHCDVLRDELRIELGLAHFSDVHLNHRRRILPSNQAVEVVGQLIDALSTTADDGAGAGGENGDLNSIGRALDLDARHIAETHSALDVLADLVV